MTPATPLPPGVTAAPTDAPTTGATTSAPSDATSAPSDATTTAAGDCAPLDCVPPVVGFQCVKLAFEASKAVFDSASGTAAVTVCGVKMAAKGGSNSRLTSLPSGGIGSEPLPLRRRSLAPNSSLELEFDSAISVTSVLLDRVDGSDAGQILLKDAASTTVNVTANSVDLASSGATPSLTIVSLSGDGFAFVRVDATRQVPTATTTALTSAVTSGSDAILPPDGETMWGPLVWWIWVAIICGAVLCIALCIVVIYCVAKRRDDDDDDPEVGWDMGGSSRHGHASDRHLQTDSPEMQSARAFVEDDDDDPNLAFRKKRLSVTPGAAAALDAYFDSPGAAPIESTPPAPAAYAGNSMKSSSFAPSFLPPPPSSAHSTMRGEESSLDQYQSLPSQPFER
jgi:hypothetical protein